jgi:peptidoglycan/LPS O-acetylase OafA/YrhL
MMFWPIYRWVKPSWQYGLVSGLSLFGMVTYAWCPNQASLFLAYFVIWWSGLELARGYVAGQRPSLKNQWRTVLTLAGFAAVIAGWIAVSGRGWRGGFGVHPVLELRHFVSSAVILVAGLAWAGIGFKGFGFIPRLFGWLAPISYAVYVLHFPVVVGAHYFAGIGPTWLELTAYVMVLLALAYGSEIKLQRWLARR